MNASTTTKVSLVLFSSIKALFSIKNGLREAMKCFHSAFTGKYIKEQNTVLSNSENFSSMSI